MLSMKRAMSGVGVISKRPSVISAMSKEVPPMSVQRTFGIPRRSAIRLAADHAADRPGDQRPRELLGLDRDRAAVRRHHPELEAGTRVLGLVAHRLQRPAEGSAA